MREKIEYELKAVEREIRRNNKMIEGYIDEIQKIANERSVYDIANFMQQKIDRLNECKIKIERAEETKSMLEYILMEEK